MAHDCVARFELSHFAEGRFRKAYKGVWDTPAEKRGKQCVVKKRKDDCTWLASDWNATIRNYNRAREIAGEFNQTVHHPTKYPVTVTNADIHPVITKTCTELGTGPSLGEYVVAEDYLDGEFVKWCGNFGYISPAAKTVDFTMPAFAHWSWYYTQGQEMVCDLQGVFGASSCHIFGSKSYNLTDPVILSVDQTNYGQTDMGIEGMAMFFLNHECNIICEKWPRPYEKDFKEKIPLGELQACQDQTTCNSTLFAFELQPFSPPAKEQVTRVFIRIAKTIAII